MRRFLPLSSSGQDICYLNNSFKREGRNCYPAQSQQLMTEGVKSKRKRQTEREREREREHIEWVNSKKKKRERQYEFQ